MKIGISNERKLISWKDNDKKKKKSANIIIITEANPSINLLINPSINLSISQALIQPFSQSVYKSVNQYVSSNIVLSSIIGRFQSVKNINVSIINSKCQNACSL